MLREPRHTKDSPRVRKDKRTGRFQIVKLEERIAPAPGTGRTEGGKCNGDHGHGLC